MIKGMPESIWQSVLFTVVAYTRINTSLSFGVGSSSSFMVSTPGEPYFVRTTAFILLFLNAAECRVAAVQKMKLRFTVEIYPVSNHQSRRRDRENAKIFL